MKKVVVFVTLALGIFASFAFGQALATPEVVIPMAEEASKWLQPENLKILFGILMTIVTIASPFLLKGFHSLIAVAKQKGNNELLSQILDRVDMAMPAIVKAIYDVFVKEAKEKAKDGKLTMDEIKVAQGMAVEKAKGILGPAALATLTKNGVDLQQHMEGLTGLHVEHAKKTLGSLSEEDEKNS